MNDRWQEIERIYHAARELDASARAEFLAKACAGDSDLRREVESLLVQADQHEIDEHGIPSPALKSHGRGLRSRLALPLVHPQLVVIGADTEHLGPARRTPLFLAWHAPAMRDTCFALGADALADRPQLVLAFLLPHEIRSLADQKRRVTQRG